MGRFIDRVIVITGASEGIGRALACELAPDRPRLVLCARNAARLEEAAAACRASGAEVLTVQADLSSQEACQRLIDRAVERFGAIDVLVNNAGITMWSRLDEMQNLSALEHVMRVNYLSAAFVTHAALPHLKKSRGLIVAVASLAGLTGVPERTGYAASKHAMVGFFESLRIELAGSAVDVTLVAPDFVVSQIHRRALGPDGKPLGSTPMQESHIMTAERCAQLMRRAMERRQRLLITSARGRFGHWARLVVPSLVDRLAARAIRTRR